MKKYLLLGFVLLVLAGCANNSGGFYKAQVRNDLVKETWMQRINTDPDRWTTHASSWFFTSAPTKFDDYASRAPATSGITAMMVRVPEFSNITIDGPFRVQLSGDIDRNNVIILGANDAARHTKVEIIGDTLYVHPATDCQTSSCYSLNDVIVRIGVRDLHRLIVNGNANVEGKHLISRDLDIQSTNSNCILLAGSMNVSRVVQNGTGTISVIGATTQSLDVRIAGDGNVNLSGHVGVCNIHKKGRGTLNIIGTDTDTLKIDSSGSGVTAIAGFVNLKNINVTERSRVYLYWVNSNGIYINVHDGSELGIAGVAKNLDIEMDGNARYWGKYMRAENIYIRTRQSAHANVSATQKLFATALDNSSIYFFGSPNVISRYAMDNAVIIPVWCDSCPTPISLKPQFVPPPPRASYKGEWSYKGEGQLPHRRAYK